MFRHSCNERLDVIAHQKHFVRAVGLSRMYCWLGGWQGEDQPIVSGVDERILEHVAEEGAVRLSVGAAEDYVRSADHVLTLDRPEPGPRRPCTPLDDAPPFRYATARMNPDPP